MRDSDSSYRSSYRFLATDLVKPFSAILAVRFILGPWGPGDFWTEASIGIAIILGAAVVTAVKFSTLRIQDRDLMVNSVLRHVEIPWSAVTGAARARLGWIRQDEILISTQDSLDPIIIGPLNDMDSAWQDIVHHLPDGARIREWRERVVWWNRERFYEVIVGGIVLVVLFYGPLSAFVKSLW